MTDLIGIAASGLRGYSAALDAVGENVAGASIPGFARRSVALAGIDPGAPNPLVRAPVTSLGVQVAGLKRSADQFLSADARAAASNDAGLTSLSTWLSTIESALTAGGQDVGSGLTAFYETAQGLKAEPGSTVARGQFLAAAGDVAQRFQATSGALDQAANAIDRSGRAAVDGINALTVQLAMLNAQLRRAEPDTAQSASLLDQRDQLLSQLAKSVGFTAIEGDRGTVSVRMGGTQGPTLVEGATPTSLLFAGGKLLFGKARADVAVQASAGTLGGNLLASRAIADARARLDTLALDFAAVTNAAQQSGVDAAGVSGESLFAETIAAVNASPANTGTASVSTSVASGGSLAPGGYALAYDGPSATWTLTHADGSNPVSGTSPLTLDGLIVTLAGASANADNFRIEPRGGAAGISLAFHDPAKIAAADPWVAGAGIANTGTGTIALTLDASASGLPAGTSYRVQMLSATSFQVIDPVSSTVLLAAQPYTPGSSIGGNGFRFTFAGTPATGDTFDIASGGTAGADAGAIERLLATRSASIGAATLEDRWANSSDTVSSAFANVKLASAAAASTLDSANAARDGATGVNLDAEATDLVRFQQAYQASAKIIQAARDIFNQLLQIG